MKKQDKHPSDGEFIEIPMVAVKSIKRLKE